MNTASLPRIEILAPAPVTIRAPETAQAQAAAIATPDGVCITAGVAELQGAGAEWSAQLARLDRPGVMATMYFAQGVREVILRLEDGRQARARISGTSFVAAAERVCQLVGLEPLA